MGGKPKKEKVLERMIAQWKLDIAGLKEFAEMLNPEDISLESRAILEHMIVFINACLDHLDGISGLITAKRSKIVSKYLEEFIDEDGCGTWGFDTTAEFRKKKNNKSMVI